MKRLPIAGLAFTGALALAACGGASAPAPAAAQATAPGAAAPAAQAAAPAPAATQAAASAPAAAGPARKIQITATNDLYSIKTLEVKTGERIEFVMKNEGDEKHNVVAIGEGLSIVSPDFDAGQTLSWTWTAPSKPQTFKFICAYHAQIPPILVSVK